MLAAGSSLGRFVLAVRGADLSGRSAAVPLVPAGRLERLGHALALQPLPQRRPPGAHRLEPSPEQRRRERRVQGGLGLLALAGALCALLPLSQRAIGLGRPEIAGLHVEVAALSLPAAAAGSTQEWKVVAKGRTRNSQGLYCWLVGLDRRTGRHRYLSAPTPCTPDLEIVLTVVAADLEWVGWDVIAGRLKAPCAGPRCQDLRNIDVVTATGDTMAALEVPSSSLTAFPVPASPSGTLPAGGPSTTTTTPAASGPGGSPGRSDGRQEYPSYVPGESRPPVPTSPGPSVTPGPTSGPDPVGTERSPDDGQATGSTTGTTADSPSSTSDPGPGTTSGPDGQTTSATQGEPTTGPTGDPSPGPTSGPTSEPTGAPGDGPGAPTADPTADPTGEP